MTDKRFYTIFGSAIEAADREAFASDWALSDIWGEEPSQSLEELAEICGRVWDLAHLTTADIRARLGLSQVAFATRFCIPLRTVQNWEVRKNTAPYIILLLAQAAGMTEGLR